MHVRIDEGRQGGAAGAVDHLDAGRGVERVAERGDLAAAHEDVEARVDALAGIEHAGAAHEHVRAGTGGLDQPPWLASAHAAASPPASTS